MIKENLALKGACLCGAVAFSIKGIKPKLYQCHCSLCRKVTGSSANAAMWINHEHFDWVKVKSTYRPIKQKPVFGPIFVKTVEALFQTLCGMVPVIGSLRVYLKKQKI